jgi:hypothetical protein
MHGPLPLIEIVPGFSVDRNPVRAPSTRAEAEVPATVSADCLLYRAFVRATATDQKRVAEHFPTPFERSAHGGRLAQETTLRRASDVPLLQKPM